MAEDGTKVYVTFIFAWQGKILIGKMLKSGSESTGTNGLIEEILGTDTSDYFIIRNPCIIEWKVEVPAQGSAEINWDLIPFYYKHMIADSGVGFSAFAFKKSEVVISNLSQTAILPDLLAAYAELCG